MDYKSGVEYYYYLQGVGKPQGAGEHRAEGKMVRVR